jgi:hypothetical protein
LIGGAKEWDGIKQAGKDPASYQCMDGCCDKCAKGRASMWEVCKGEGKLLGKEEEGAMQGRKGYLIP